MLDALLFFGELLRILGPGDIGLEQFIERAAELGFEGVMLGANGRTCRCSIGDRPTGAAAGANRKTRHAPRLRRGLHQLHGGPGTRRDSAARISNPLRDALAEFARDLGGDLVRVFTGYENPAAEYGGQWTLVVER